MKNFLRWLGVIPAFVGGFLIGPIFMNLVASMNVWFLGGSEAGLLYKASYWLVAPFFGGLLGVYWGVKVAPSNKKIVSIVLSFLIVILVTVSTLYSTDLTHITGIIISAIAAIAGAGYVMYEFFQDENFSITENN